MVLSGTLLGLPGPLVAAREAGIFRNYKINGVPALSILSIPALTTMLHALLVTVVIALTAPAIFRGLAPANWAAFFLVFLVSAFACAGIGVLIGVISTNTRMTVLFRSWSFFRACFRPRWPRWRSSCPRPTPWTPSTAWRWRRPEHVRGCHSRSSQPGRLLAFALAVFLFSWDSKNAARHARPAFAALALVLYLVGLLLSL